MSSSALPSHARQPHTYNPWHHHSLCTALTENQKLQLVTAEPQDPKTHTTQHTTARSRHTNHPPPRLLLLLLLCPQAQVLGAPVRDAEQHCWLVCCSTVWLVHNEVPLALQLDDVFLFECGHVDVAQCGCFEFGLGVDQLVEVIVLLNLCVTAAAAKSHNLGQRQSLL